MTVPFSLTLASHDVTLLLTLFAFYLLVIRLLSLQRGPSSTGSAVCSAASMLPSERFLYRRKVSLSVHCHGARGSQRTPC